MIAKLARRALVVAALLFAVAGAAIAQTQPPDGARAQIDQARAALAQIESSFARETLSDAELASRRDQIGPITDRLNQAIEQIAPRLEAARARLEQLGPKPAADAPAEAPAAAATRAEQEKLVADLDASLRQARLLQVQANQIADTITSRRRALFARALFEQTSSLLSPALWRTVASDLPNETRAIGLLFGDWWRSLVNQAQPAAAIALAVMLALALALSARATRAAARLFPRDPGVAAPSRYQIARAALWTALTTAAVPTLTAAGLANFAVSFGLAPGRMQPIVWATVEAVGLLAMTLGLARGALAPDAPAWRPLRIGDAAARRLARIATTTIAVIVVTRLAEVLLDMVGAALAITVAIRGLGALAAGLVLWRGLSSLNPPPAVAEADPEPEAGTPEPAARDWFAPARLAAWSAIAIAFAAALVGYIAFAAFLVQQIAWIAGVTAILFLAWSFSEAAVEAALSPSSRAARLLSQSVGLKRESLGQIVVLCVGTTQFLLAVGAVLLALAPWGIQSQDMVGSLRTAFFGFQIGDVTISLSSIAIAIALFIAGVLLTRALQRWLDTKYLPQTSLDAGLRNSIRTSFGYVGFIVAAGMGLAQLGLSFDRIAIVAGALSVGIGFGLQSIVSNFVSGLILLWERAIRVGDWIVVGDEQGYVQRINVRSTEIQTFDRATVIVPNANLVSGVVKNWLRNDRIGRVKTQVGVSYEADPEQVRDILIAAARSHELVEKAPAPVALFTGFGDSALNFELICFVGDVEKSMRVRSDINFEVFRRLKEAGISIPYPQRDMNLRGVEGLAEAIGRLGAKAPGQG